MRKAIATLVLLAMAAAPVMAANIAKDGYYEGTTTKHIDQIGERSTALIVSVIEGTFTDQAPAYASALEAAGHAVDIIYDPLGVWPDMSQYDLLLVTTADNWWGYNWLPGDEQAIMAYMDAGGVIIFMSQDFLYFRVGGHIGFPMDYLGVCGVVMDPTFGDEGDLTWEGTVGGILEGMYGSLPGAIGICYEGNSFFADDVDPCTQGLALWTTPLGGPFPFYEGGNTEANAVFNTFDFSCTQDPAELDTIIGIFVEHLGGGVPTENTTWGSIKGMYR